MRTRSASNLPVESPPNPSTSNPKRRKRKRSKQHFILEESPIDTMADQRTMVELLRAPTEGYAEQLWFPRFMLSNSSSRAARRWLEKEPPHSILTWEDLVLKFINELFPPSRTTNLRNEISNFQQRFDESFHEAWDRYKDLLCACPHHGFTELHQLDTFYNALNPADQDSLNSATGGNLLERQIAKLTYAVNQQTSVVTTAMTAILNQFQATPPPASVKSAEEIYVTCGGAHPYYQCPAAGGNTFPKLRDNIQGYVVAATVNYNQGNFVYCPLVTGIARDVFVPVGKFTFPADFVIVDYESDHIVPLILGRPFLWTARALIDIYREEMILRDGDERLTLNMRHDTSSYSNQHQKESINLINVFNDSNEDFLKDLFSTNHQSGNLTFSSHLILTSSKVKDDIFDPEHHFFFFSKKLLEEFADEFTLITFLTRNDNVQFDIESDLKEIEYLLHHDPSKDIGSILKDSIDQSNLADLNDNLVDSMPEMFTDEHALDYSSFPLYDEYDDDLFKVESDTENVYDDPFDSKGEKIKESKLLVNELDLPCDFLLPSEYDSFFSKNFSKVDALPLTNNEDKVFNPCILIQETLFEVITHVALEKNEKKLAISHASLILEDFDPPLYELSFFKEVLDIPRFRRLMLKDFVLQSSFPQLHLGIIIRVNFDLIERVEL
uniref:Retrotransposon gag domain-containing protein n=1 Tax=Tanacetum cinerariifolium TaxID=118510 RepID=A0A6L2KZ26_TANCI|nr:hypothetical protein [Tanacetum cinerariifolium]